MGITTNIRNVSTSAADLQGTVAARRANDGSAPSNTAPTSQDSSPIDQFNRNGPSASSLGALGAIAHQTGFGRSGEVERSVSDGTTEQTTAATPEGLSRTTQSAVSDGPFAGYAGTVHDPVNDPEGQQPFATGAGVSVGNDNASLGVNVSESADGSRTIGAEVTLQTDPEDASDDIDASVTASGEIELAPIPEAFGGGVGQTGTIGVEAELELGPVELSGGVSRERGPDGFETREYGAQVEIADTVTAGFSREQNELGKLDTVSASINAGSVEVGVSEELQTGNTSGFIRGSWDGGDSNASVSVSDDPLAGSPRVSVGFGTTF